MANPFERLVARMDDFTQIKMGKTATINGVDYVVVESHFLPEMAQLNGDGISLVVFTPGYEPTKNDVVVLDGREYMVTRHQLFNGKPQIWIE